MLEDENQASSDPDFTSSSDEEAKDDGTTEKGLLESDDEDQPVLAEVDGATDMFGAAPFTQQFNQPVDESSKHERSTSNGSDVFANAPFASGT